MLVVDLHVLEDEDMIRSLEREKFVEMCLHGSQSWQQGVNAFTKLPFVFVCIYMVFVCWNLHTHHALQYYTLINVMVSTHKFLGVKNHIHTHTWFDLNYICVFVMHVIFFPITDVFSSIVFIVLLVQQNHQCVVLYKIFQHVTCYHVFYAHLGLQIAPSAHCSHEYVLQCCVLQSSSHAQFFVSSI